MDLLCHKFFLDSKRERTAVREAVVAKIPVVALIDTNSDPSGVSYPIPGNDDAIRAVKLFASRIADACIEGAHRYSEKQQADADKTGDVEVAEKEAPKKTGPVERRVISDGKEGPIVEVIRKTGTVETAVASESANTEEAPASENTGE